MVTMFVKHKVNDYDNWKRVYDSFAATREEMGVTGASVHRDASDSGVVTVIHQFDDVDAAQKYASSEKLRSAMKEAGVAGPPDIWFTEDVERTRY